MNQDDHQGEKNRTICFPFADVCSLFVTNLGDDFDGALGLLQCEPQRGHGLGSVWGGCGKYNLLFRSHHPTAFSYIHCSQNVVPCVTKHEGASSDREILILRARSQNMHVDFDLTSDHDAAKMCQSEGVDHLGTLWLHQVLHHQQAQKLHVLLNISSVDKNKRFHL